MKGLSKPEMKRRIDELELRLEESEQLIDAIKAGEVDAFAINKNSESEIFTLFGISLLYALRSGKSFNDFETPQDDAKIIKSTRSENALRFFILNILPFSFDKFLICFIQDLSFFIINPFLSKRFSHYVFEGAHGKNIPQHFS